MSSFLLTSEIDETTYSSSRRRVNLGSDDPSERSPSSGEMSDCEGEER